MPSVLRVLKRANDHSIPYGLMEKLNYTDLKSMILDYDIDSLESMMKNKEQERLQSKGVESRRKATAEDWNNL